jgi:HEAT repeat protein
VCLAVALLDRSDLAPGLRGLLAAPDATVRVCATEAVGAVGKAALIAPLQRLLDDPEPTVRIAAVWAVGRACRSNGRVDLARSWLARPANDPAAEVRDAAAAALAFAEDRG